MGKLSQTGGGYPIERWPQNLYPARVHNLLVTVYLQQVMSPGEVQIYGTGGGDMTIGCPVMFRLRKSLHRLKQVLGTQYDKLLQTKAVVRPDADQKTTIRISSVLITF
jgi:hypothetical protein